MRPTPDAATWARLSALFDTGSELPAELRQAWLATLGEDEAPALVGWLRDMLSAAGAGADAEIERGPLLPPWDGTGDPAAAPQTMEAAQTPAIAPSASEESSESPNPVAPGVDPTDPVGEEPIAAGTAVPAAPSLEPGDGVGAAPAPIPEVTGASAAPPSPADADADAAADTDAEAPAGADADAVAEAVAKAEPGHGQVPESTAPPPSTPSSEQPAQALPARLSLPSLATGMRLGPWRLVGPMNSSDARVDQWRARLADEEPAGPEVALLLPRQWRPRTDLGAWLAHAAARPMGLAHPHIARLTAVGVTSEGTPWIASELAEGQSIERWCRDHPLGLAERRVLVEQAVEAATFAHGRLVLHGHVHPSQIVLSPDGHLRFLNFGLSELLDLLDTPHPPSAHGSGGPPARAYAPPEQQGKGTADDAPSRPTASGDIHALGLVAFEVLSGASPWQPRAPGTKVVPAPGSLWPRPSDFANVRRLRKGLRGDLDAIVAKATQTDPSHRYASVAALLDDVRRAGKHQPVTAVDGGFGYQVRCLARRHPRFTSVAMAGAAVFLVFLGALSWKAWVWSGERDRAEAARLGGEAVTRLLQDLLKESAAPGDERDWPELLTRAEAVARSSLKNRPQDLAAVLALLGREHADRGAFAEARNLLAEALPNLADPTTALEVGCDEAWAQARQGDKPDEAELRIRRVIENGSVRHATRSLCLVRVADLERRSGRARDAFGSTSRAWQHWAATPDKPLQLAVLLARPAGLQSAALGFFHEGQVWYDWALKRLELLQQDKGPIAVELREQWGEVSLAAGDAERAVKLADDNLAAVAGAPFPADADPATAAPALLFLAAAEPRLDLQRLAEARARLERAVALADARDDAALRQRARCAMAVAALRERDTATAERWLKAASPEVPAGGGRAAAVGSASGSDAPMTTTPAAQPAGVLGVAPASPADEARNAARAALRDADHACRAAAIELALQQGRHTEAQREADRLLGAGNELSPRLHAVANLLRAEATLAARQYERALSAGLQALQQARALHKSDVEDEKARPSFRSGQAALVLAEAHRASGDIEEAKKTLDYAMQQLSATLPESHPWRRRAEATKAALAVHATKKP